MGLNRSMNHAVSSGSYPEIAFTDVLSSGSEEVVVQAAVGPAGAVVLLPCPGHRSAYHCRTEAAPAPCQPRILKM